MFGANQAGKHACSLLNCISVTDDTRINEQDKSIATGLLYVRVFNVRTWEILTCLISDICTDGIENNQSSKMEKNMQK